MSCGHVIPGILLILSVLVTVTLTLTTCTNVINGSEVEWQCNFECCLDKGSYAISLQDSEVCSDGNYECGPASQAIPTSCPIKVKNKPEMFGCGVGEVCCHHHSDIPEFDYQVTDKYLVCSVDGECEDYNSGPDDTWPGFDDLDVEEHYYWDVFCYENCFTVTHFTTNIGVLETDLYSTVSCLSDNVRVCTAAAEEACLSFNIKATTNDQESMEIMVSTSYCGSIVNVNKSKPALLCDRVEDQLKHLMNESGSGNTTGIKPGDVVVECGKLKVCTENCVDAEHAPVEDDAVGWWVILIICLLVLIAVIALVLLCVYIKCCRRRTVAPKDEETPIAIETVDPRKVRMLELDRYLTDCIMLKDVADLKLTIDMVEQEGYQDDLRDKYNEAVRLFEELMAREKEAKLKELEESERKAEEAKRALEEAENEVLRRQKEEEEEALRQAIKARDAAKARFMRMWPRLQILRALNSLNSEMVVKAMEEARKAREEEEKERKLAEEQANKINHCKQLLKHGIDTLNEDHLENALKTTDLAVFQTTIMQTDDELRTLYSQAKVELDKLREERERKAKEAEEQRKEEERIRQEKRRAALAKLEELKAALRRGIAEKDIEKLIAAIQDVEENHLEEDMTELYKQATELLARLEKIEKVKKNIQELKRPLIAELKSMTSPPIPVHRTMTATYLLLGEDPKDLKEWNNIVILLNKTGRASIKRRVQELKFQDVSEEGAREVEGEILGLTAMEVYEANQAASLFFDWAEMICYERKQAV